MGPENEKYKWNSNWKENCRWLSENTRLSQAWDGHVKPVGAVANGGFTSQKRNYGKHGFKGFDKKTTKRSTRVSDMSVWSAVKLNEISVHFCAKFWGDYPIYFTFSHTQKNHSERDH